MKALHAAAIAALLAAGFLGGRSAQACMNDRRTAPLEKFHREQYEPDPPEEPQRAPLVIAGMGSGTLLIAASIFLGLRRR